jgi:hypothetical protein
MRVPASAYSSVCLSVCLSTWPENSLHSENDDDTIPKAVYMKRQIHAKICLVCREFTIFFAGTTNGGAYTLKNNIFQT